MIGAGIGAGELFAAIRPIYGRNQEIGSVVTEDGTEKIKLSSRQSDQRDIWAMQYYPFRVGDKEYKLAELAKVEKGQMPQEVAKENQQYRLCLQYEYIGASEQGNKLLKKTWKSLMNFSRWDIRRKRKVITGHGVEVPTNSIACS